MVLNKDIWDPKPLLPNEAYKAMSISGLCPAAALVLTLLVGNAGGHVRLRNSLAPDSTQGLRSNVSGSSSVSLVGFFSPEGLG